MALSQHKYEQLSGKDESVHNDAEYRHLDSLNAEHHTFTRYQLLCLASTMIASVLATTAILALCQLLVFHPSPTEPGSLQTIRSPKYFCGNSTTEAKSLGCRFSPLTMSWLPDVCHDDELAAEFQAIQPWQYFNDQNGTREISLEDAAESAGTGMELWISLQWHVTHCSYVWKKMHRAWERGSRLEKTASQYRHTVHCGRVMMNRMDRDRLLTIVTPIFEQC